MTVIRFVCWCIGLAWAAQLVLAALLLTLYGLGEMRRVVFERQATRKTMEVALEDVV